jgi:hydroxymethylpyrimidine/phosphomethylpyrimidine kinase
MLRDSVTPPPPSVLLTIAGHDPSSGAGITADLQVFSAHRLFGASALTALTVQSTLGVAEVQPVDPAFLAHSLTHLTADLPPVGIKIGMLGSSLIAETVANFLHSLRNKAVKQGTDSGSSPLSARNLAPIPIVLDPILRASSGASLLPSEALESLHLHLLPHVTWITPNWSELAALTGLPVETLPDAADATRALAARHPHLHIVATAGDQPQPTDLFLLPPGVNTRTEIELHQLAGEHIATTSTHGTGCAFSSALLCRIVLGDSPLAAVHAAKLYVAEALRRAPRLGHGRGPLNLL